MTSVSSSPTVTLPGDVRMPLVGFGTWQLRGRGGRQAVRAALEAGYRHIDTATMYGNEAEVGRALASSGIDRGEVFLTTKLLWNRVGEERATLAASLRALGVDQVDLWLVHWPPDEGRLVAVWRTFLAMREAGLARAVGVSNHSLDQVDRITEATGQAPAVNQLPWSPARHDPALLAGHRERGIAVVGYSPLKRTNLADPVLGGIAAARGVTPAQVVLRWHLQHGIGIIPKSSHPGRITANFDLFGFELTPGEMEQIDALSR